MLIPVMNALQVLVIKMASVFKRVKKIKQKVSLKLIKL